METKVEIDKASMRKMQATIRQFAEITGKTAEDGVKMVAKSACRRLVITVQPYGLKSMDKFEKSIEAQVRRVWFGVNLGAFPASTDMKRAHNDARRNGSVPKRLFRKEKGKPWLNLISEADRDAHIKVARRKAGEAKAAWVRVANSLGGPKMSGIPKAIAEDVDNAKGEVKVSGKGLNVRIQIANNTSYIAKIQDSKSIAQATAYGLKNGYKRIQKIIDKEIEKANRDLK